MVENDADAHVMQGFVGGNVSSTKPTGYCSGLAVDHPSFNLEQPDTPVSAQAMNIEPFGPLALVSRFERLEDGLAEANRLPFGLAAYAFTLSSTTAVTVCEEMQSGGIGINSFAVAQIEAPFGGIKDSGYGNEGGHEGLEAFLHPKYIHHAA